VFTLKVSLRSNSVVSRMVLPRAQPALLIRTVGAPKTERTEEAALVMDAVEARSQWK
jgi:hypothetical protein